MNDDPDNKYDIVQFYGNRDREPWREPHGAQFIANVLRECRFVGLGLSSVVPVQWGCGQLHLMTAWGDDGPNNTDPVQDDPNAIKVTDSDDTWKTGGEGTDVQTYHYVKPYDHPLHPQGPGWYLEDYWMTPPRQTYIMNITNLLEGHYSLPEDCGEAVKVVGSYRITQDDPTPATGLHYRVGTDTEAYWYLMKIGRQGDSTVTDLPSCSPPCSFDVTWDLSGEPVGQDDSLTIFTEFALCEENDIFYWDVYFTYLATKSTNPVQSGSIPSFKIAVMTDTIPGPRRPHACGGHVVGAFELYDDDLRTNLLGEFRFEHEYNYDQDPEIHGLVLEALGSTACWVGDLRFGHSYGFLETEALWAFDDWMTEYSTTEFLDSTLSIVETLDWTGRLPYPWYGYSVCPDTTTCWKVRHGDLFQDNFPYDGGITCQNPARADMARDILPATNPGIIPGDSSVVEVVDDSSFVYTPLDPEGGPEPDTSIPPQVYCWVRVGSHLCTPGHTPTSIESPDDTRYPGDPMAGTQRFPFTGVMLQCGPWTYWQYQMDFVYAPDGSLVPDRYCIDLMDIADGLHASENQPANVGAFVPGDTVYYFFEAVTNDGLTSYWHRQKAYRLGQGSSNTTLSWAEACTQPCEFMILPNSGRPDADGDILLVDDADDRGGPAEVYFDFSFAALGLMDATGSGLFQAAFDADVDIYDVNDPSSAVGNSLASRVMNNTTQLIGTNGDVYRKILWNTGDLSRGLVGDGGPPNGGTGPEKSDDWSMLDFFMRNHQSFPGVAFFGDDLAEEWITLGPSAAGYRTTWMNFNLLSGSGPSPFETVRGDLPESIYLLFDQVSMPHTPPYTDYWIAISGLPLFNDFDVLAPVGPPCSEQAEYVTDGRGAVLAQETLNDEISIARCVLSGHAFNHIYNEDPPLDGPPHAWMDRTEVLWDILTWVANIVPEPVGVDPAAFVNRLYDAYPNPFNPTTTIRYEIKERTHVSLKIYNVAGQLVRTLVNEVQIPKAGGFKKEWNGRNNAGDPVASGVYFYRLVTKDFTKTKKTVVLK